MNSLGRFVQFAAAALAGIGAMACCTASGAGRAASGPESTPQRIARLQFGMPEEKVREILGNPGMEIGPDELGFAPSGMSPDWSESIKLSLSDIHRYRRWHYGVPPPKPAPEPAPTLAEISHWVIHPIRSFQEELGEAFGQAFGQAIGESIAPSSGSYIVVFHEGGLHQVLRVEGSWRLTPCMTPPERS